MRSLSSSDQDRRRTPSVAERTSMFQCFHSVRRQYIRCGHGIAGQTIEYKVRPSERLLSFHYFADFSIGILKRYESRKLFVVKACYLPLNRRTDILDR